MSERKDGGAAFPMPAHEEKHFADDRVKILHPAYPGMSLRDFFAAAALTGLLANKEFRVVGGPSDERTAARAYEFADALLSARVKP